MYGQPVVIRTNGKYCRRSCEARSGSFCRAIDSIEFLEYKKCGKIYELLRTDSCRKNGAA